LFDYSPCNPGRLTDKYNELNEQHNGNSTSVGHYTGSSSSSDESCYPKTNHRGDWVCPINIAIEESFRGSSCRDRPNGSSTGIRNRLERKKSHRDRRYSVKPQWKTSKINLLELKQFTKYPSDDGELSARTFLIQFEREASLIGIGPRRYMNILLFVLQKSALSWFNSKCTVLQNSFARLKISKYEKMGHVATAESNTYNSCQPTQRKFFVMKNEGEH